MKSDQKAIAEAVRIEFDKKTGDLFIVFKVSDEKKKKDIINNWTNDIEYKLIDKLLVENE